MKRAYSLIELLIVVAIIGILTSMSVVILSGVRSRARDSNRKESLGAYRVSLEQYKTGTGHYVVDKSFGNSSAGYMKQGWGRMTRKNLTDGTYPSRLSIADVLQQSGYLTLIQTDPSIAGLEPSIDVTGGSTAVSPVNSQVPYPITNDYFLVACNYDGSNYVSNGGDGDQALSDGIQFALYANLETPPINGANIPSNQCGATLSLPDKDSASGTGMPKDEFNYVLGSSL